MRNEGTDEPLRDAAAQQETQQWVVSVFLSKPYDVHFALA